MHIQMVAPDLTGYRCDVSEVFALFSGSGGPLNKLRSVTISDDYTSIELEFNHIHLEPESARAFILDEMRRRSSMHPQLARWILRSTPAALKSEERKDRAVVAD